MARQEYWLETRVIVTPRLVINKMSYADDCARDIVADIERHVDNVGDAEIEQIYESKCSFCGWSWKEDDPYYNGGCCEEDEKNAPRDGD